MMLDSEGLQKTIPMWIAIYRRDGHWHEDDIEVEVPVDAEGQELTDCINEWVRRVYGPDFYFEYM